MNVLTSFLQFLGLEDTEKKQFFNKTNTKEDSILKDKKYKHAIDNIYKIETKTQTIHNGNETIQIETTIENIPINDLESKQIINTKTHSQELFCKGK